MTLRRRLPLVAAAAALLATATPAGAHHACAPGETPIHVTNPLTGRETVWTCGPSLDSRPLVEDCPPGQSGTVVNVPFVGSFAFCEGP